MTARLLLISLLLLGAQAAQPFEVKRDIVYARTPQRALTLDLYLPDSSPNSYPVILYVHGGGWSSGSKEKPPADRLVQRGYAVASIEYRLSQEAPFPAQIYDCKAAVRWLRAHAEQYRLDPDHIVAWGGSAGGHLVALLGTSGGVRELEGDLGNPGYSSRVAGVIDFFGPTDFLQLNKARRKPRPETDQSPEAKLIGGRLTDHLDLVRQANPITFVTKDDPPFLLLHGDEDDVVPPHQSELLLSALRQAGVPASYHLIKGRGHGFRTGPDIDPWVDQFLNQYAPVRPPAAAVKPITPR